MSIRLNKSLLVMQPVIAAIVPFFLLPIYISLFNEKELSTFFILQVIGNVVAQISSFSTMAGFENIYYKVEDNKAKLNLLVSSTFIFNIVTLILFFTFFSNPILNFLESRNIIFLSGSLIFIYLFVYCINFAFEFFLYNLRNENLIKIFFIGGCIQHFISLILIIPIAIFYDYLFTFKNIILILISSFLIKFFYLMSYMIYSKKFIFTLDMQILKRVLKISYPLIFRIFPNLIQTQFDKIIVISLLGPSVMNLYAIAQKCGTAIQVFYNSIDRIFKPKFYRLKLIRSKNIDSYIYKFYMVGTGICILAFFNGPLVSLAFLGKIDETFISIFTLFIAYQCTLFLSKLLGMEFISIGRTKDILFGALINIIIYILFILFFYFFGNINIYIFVISLLISNIFTCVFLIYAGKKEFLNTYKSIKILFVFLPFGMYFLPLQIYDLSVYSYYFINIIFVVIYTLYSIKIIYEKD